MAGENAILGNAVTFPGHHPDRHLQSIRLFGGLHGPVRDGSKENGYEDIITVINASTDKPNFMDGLFVITKLVAEKKTGRILGAQCVGPGNVAKQIAQWAMAIQAGCTWRIIVNADLPYAPPFSLAIDHFIATAHLMQNKMKGRLKGISPMEVEQRVACDGQPFLIDTRGPDEYEQMRLGHRRDTHPPGGSEEAAG